MRLRKKIFSAVIAGSCLSFLLAAYSADKKLPFSLSPPELPSPLAAAEDSPILKYPIKEREGDFVTDKPTNPFYLKDPPAIQEDVEYDPTTGMYVVTEKAGGV